MASDLEKRMKENYENVSKTGLVRRMPVIIRLDGRAFHTFTKGFDKPFDERLMDAMQNTMKYLCENTMGCVLGYVQSDEISLLLIDYKKLDSQAFFDYQVQKLCSITASMATLAFNRTFSFQVLDIIMDVHCTKNKVITPNDRQLVSAYEKAIKSGAMFDSRCFNVPKEEVCNYFLSRQIDAARNSVQMVGQANFSHSQLHKLSNNQIQEKLFTEKGINWNDFPNRCKRGSCCIKTDDGWMIDNDIPMFKGEDRNYIEALIEAEE